jgi:hypothetical protein
VLLVGPNHMMRSGIMDDRLSECNSELLVEMLFNKNK